MVRILAPANDEILSLGLRHGFGRWDSATTRPLADEDLLVWVYGPFVGRWNASRGVWEAKPGGVVLEPVRFWARINRPQG